MNWEDATTIRVFTNGIHFEVVTAGVGDQVALCLHGFPESAYSWRYQFPLLTESGYRVWAPNLRGYGRSDEPPLIADYTMDKLVKDVVGLIRESRAKELLLIAHDWGAVLAWMIAMHHPDLISKLIICNVPHPACFLRELKKPRQFLRSWYMAFFQIPWLPEALLNLVVKRKGGARGMIHWYRALVQQGAWRRFVNASYPKIETPTLFIWGDADTALSIRTTDGTDEFVSDLTFKVLPGVSHWVQQEAHEQVNSIIETWLISRGALKAHLG